MLNPDKKAYARSAGEKIIAVCAAAGLTPAEILIANRASDAAIELVFEKLGNDMRLAEAALAVALITLQSFREMHAAIEKEAEHGT